MRGGQSFLAVVVSALLVAAGGELPGRTAAAASCSTRGLGYHEALVYKAQLRAQAIAAARRAAARARAERREAAQIAYFSGLYGARTGRWYPLVHRHFPGHEREALYVIRGESGGNPGASNGICRGLFQLHVCHAAAFRRVTGKPYFNGVYDPAANIRFAAHMSNGGRNWSAWSVRP